MFGLFRKKDESDVAVIERHDGTLFRFRKQRRPGRSLYRTLRPGERWARRDRVARFLGLSSEQRPF